MGGWVSLLRLIWCVARVRHDMSAQLPIVCSFCMHTSTRRLRTDIMYEHEWRWVPLLRSLVFGMYGISVRWHCCARSRSAPCVPLLSLCVRVHCLRTSHRTRHSTVTLVVCTRYKVSYQGVCTRPLVLFCTGSAVQGLAAHRAQKQQCGIK